MRPNRAASSSADLADRVELRQDPATRKADALPLLVRLLRRLVEVDERKRTLPLRPPDADQAAVEKAG